MSRRKSGISNLVSLIHSNLDVTEAIHLATPLSISDGKLPDCKRVKLYFNCQKFTFLLKFRTLPHFRTLYSEKSGNFEMTEFDVESRRSIRSREPPTFFQFLRKERKVRSIVSDGNYFGTIVIKLRQSCLKF